MSDFLNGSDDGPVATAARALAGADDLAVVMFDYRARTVYGEPMIEVDLFVYPTDGAPVWSRSFPDVPSLIDELMGAAASDTRATDA